MRKKRKQKAFGKEFAVDRPFDPGYNNSVILSKRRRWEEAKAAFTGREEGRRLKALRVKAFRGPTLSPGVRNAGVAGHVTVPFEWRCARIARRKPGGTTEVCGLRPYVLGARAVFYAVCASREQGAWAVFIPGALSPNCEKR